MWKPEFDPRIGHHVMVAAQGVWTSLPRQDEKANQHNDRRQVCLAHTILDQKVRHSSASNIL